MRPSMIKWKAVKFQRVQKSRKVNIGQSNQESLSEKRFEYEVCRIIIRIDTDLCR